MKRRRDDLKKRQIDARRQENLGTERPSASLLLPLHLEMAALMASKMLARGATGLSGLLGPSFLGRAVPAGVLNSQGLLPSAAAPASAANQELSTSAPAWHNLPNADEKSVQWRLALWGGQLKA